jgi:hypothetical protein
MAPYRSARSTPLSRRVAVAVIAGAAALLLFLTFRPSEPGFWRPGPLVRSESFGEYEVKVYRRDDDSLIERICDKLPSFISKLTYRVPGFREWGGVEILRNHRRVYSAYGPNPWIAEYGSKSVMGLDITGDRTPKIALTDQLGRQGGGFIVLFDCGASFQKIAEIESWGKYPELLDLDGDGIPELIVSDNAFYHWPGCQDGEPMPEVILRWRNGSYVAAKELMYRPAPAAEALEATAAAIRSSLEWNTESLRVPPGLWTNAIALMYSGHEGLGWEFVDKAWQPGFAESDAVMSKKDLIDHWLRSRLEQSVYAPDILKVGFSTAR